MPVAGGETQICGFTAGLKLLLRGPMGCWMLRVIGACDLEKYWFDFRVAHMWGWIPKQIDGGSTRSCYVFGILFWNARILSFCTSVKFTVYIFVTLSLGGYETLLTLRRRKKREREAPFILNKCVVWIKNWYHYIDLLATESEASQCDCTASCFLTKIF